MCRQGASVIQSNVLGKIDNASLRNDVSLRALIAWVPILPDDSEEAAQESGSLVFDERATHYWDAEKELPPLEQHKFVANSMMNALRMNEPVDSCADDLIVQNIKGELVKATDRLADRKCRRSNGFRKHELPADSGDLVLDGNVIAVEAVFEEMVGSGREH